MDAKAMAGVLGIHHISATCGPAQENLDFYARVLGMRLVKQTVNYDDPAAYHLYYGDPAGTPGSLLTFFPYPAGYPGRPGSGQATVTSLAVPMGSLGAWLEAFKANEVDHDRVVNRSGTQALPFRAPDGLLLELVASPDHVGGGKSVSGIRASTMVVRELAPTEAVLVGLLGMRKTMERENRHRYEMGEGGPGKIVRLIVDDQGLAGRGGHGSVHHVAFRVPDEEALIEKRLELVERGFHATEVRDRTYFKSVYFREPGGILLELATDGPGFAVDEPSDELGKRLCLPKNLEDRRWQIQRALEPLRF